MLKVYSAKRLRANLGFKIKDLNTETRRMKEEKIEKNKGYIGKA